MHLCHKGRGGVAIGGGWRTTMEVSIIMLQVTLGDNEVTVSGQRCGQKTVNGEKEKQTEKASERKRRER